MKKQLEYEYDTQVHLVNALCCLHNFIRMESDSDDNFDIFTGEVQEEKRESDQRDEAKQVPRVILHKDVTDKERHEAKKTEIKSQRKYEINTSKDPRNNNKNKFVSLLVVILYFIY